MSKQMYDGLPSDEVKNVAKEVPAWQLEEVPCKYERGETYRCPVCGERKECITSLVDHMICRVCRVHLVPLKNSNKKITVKGV